MLGLSYTFNELEVVSIGEEVLMEERGRKGSPLNLECIKQRVISISVENTHKSNTWFVKLASFASHDVVCNSVISFVHEDL
jgi:hypothetical protein